MYRHANECGSLYVMWYYLYVWNAHMCSVCVCCVYLCSHRTYTFVSYYYCLLIHIHAQICTHSSTIAYMFTYLFIHCLIAHTNIYLIPIFINERHRHTEISVTALHSVCVYVCMRFVCDDDDRTAVIPVMVCAVLSLTHSFTLCFFFFFFIRRFFLS